MPGTGIPLSSDDKAKAFAEAQIKAIKQVSQIRIEEESRVIDMLSKFYEKYKDEMAKSDDAAREHMKKAEEAAITFVKNYREKYYIDSFQLQIEEAKKAAEQERSVNGDVQDSILDKKLLAIQTERKSKLESINSELEANRKALKKKHDEEMAYELAMAQMENKSAEEIETLRKTILDRQFQEMQEQAKLERQMKRELIDATVEEGKLKAKMTKESIGENKKLLASMKDDFKDAWKTYKENVGDGAGAKGLGNGVAGLLKGLTKATDIKGKIHEDAENKKAKADASAEKLAGLQDALKESQKAYQDAKDSGASEEELQELLDQQAQLRKEEQEAHLEATRDANAANVAAMKDAVADAMGDAYKNALGQAESILTDYMGSINARMQGSEKTFEKMSDQISSRLSINPYVKTTDVLNKLKEASDAGINYNIEQRAFLASLTDKIATTFNAFDSNLLRIIKLQQADSTATRLGMEASLTKLFNSMFEDSSYLTDVADQISGAIVDANSQLNHQASAEFEYVVQKWLGALSSLGMDGNSLTQIATGLNYLATGDVTNLSNNESLQTLFAMAASNANLEYSEILLKGLDAETTNKLLESAVVYLKSIADESENQVVKAAYGDIFNLSMSDMRALSNISDAEISSLAKTNMSYSQMETEIQNQMNQISKRVNLGAMMANIKENVMYSVASDMVNNPVTYAMQTMLDWMNSTETDINIPFVNAFGSGLDLNASVKDLMQMGLGIGQAFSLTSNLLSGLSSGGGMDLNDWGASETTKRVQNQGLDINLDGLLGGVSNSIGTFATSGNSDDVKNSTMSSATDDAEESKQITNKNTKAEVTFEDLYKAIVGESAESFATTRDITILSAYDSGKNSLRTSLEGLKFSEDYMLVKDPTLVATVVSEASGIKTTITSLGFSSLATTISTEAAGIKSAIYSLAYDYEYNTDGTGTDDEYVPSGGILPPSITITTNGVTPINVAIDGISTTSGYISVKDVDASLDTGPMSVAIDGISTTSGYISVKEIVDPNADTSVTISGLEFDSEYLKVKDSSLYTLLNTVLPKLIPTENPKAGGSATQAKTLDDFYNSIVGQQASSYVVTKDSSLDAIIDASTKSIKVSIDGFTFSEKSLIVKDELLLGAVQTGFSGLMPDETDDKTSPNTNAKTLDDLYTAVVGSQASSYVITKDTTLEKIVDASTMTLSTSVSGLIFSDGNLNVSDGLLLSEVKTGLTSALASVIGQQSSSFMSVKDATIDSVFDSATGAFRVSMGALKTSETGLIVTESNLSMAYNGSATSINTYVTNGLTFDGSNLLVKDSGVADTVFNELDKTRTTITENIDRFSFPTKTIDNIFESIIGEQAASYVKVKSDTLDSAYDQASGTLQVSMGALTMLETGLSVTDSTLVAVHDGSAEALRVVVNGLVFSDNDLLVHDSILAGAIATEFGATRTALTTEIDRFAFPGKTTDDLYEAMIGEQATSHVVTRDLILSEVLDPAASTLKVTVDGLNYVDSCVSVRDEGLITAVQTELSLIRDLLSELKVDQTIKIADDQTVKIDPDTLKAALKEVLYGADSKDSDFTKVIAAASDARGVKVYIEEAVPVANAPVGDFMVRFY